MTTPQEPESKPRRNPWRLTLAIIVPLVVAWFITQSIRNNWLVIRAHDWTFHPGWLGLASALYLLVIVQLTDLWRRLLIAIARQRLPLGRAYRVSALANLGKYLPGKIWTVMGVIYLLRRDGYPGPATFAAAILHQAFTVLAGALFTLLTIGTDFWRGMPVIPVILGLGLSAAILYPPFFIGVLNWGLRVMRRDPVSIQLPLAQSLGLFVFYMVAWSLYGLAFWCFLRGVGIEGLPFWRVAASSCGAYLAGFLALFAPGGLGIREGVLAVLLTPLLGPGIPAAVAVLSRLWMTFAELIGLAPLLTPMGKPTESD